MKRGSSRVDSNQVMGGWAEWIWNLGKGCTPTTRRVVLDEVHQSACSTREIDKPISALRSVEIHTKRKSRQKHSFACATHLPPPALFADLASSKRNVRGANAVVALSGTGPERPPSGRQTGGGSAATGSVVPIGFLERCSPSQGSFRGLPGGAPSGLFSISISRTHLRLRFGTRTQH